MKLTYKIVPDWPKLAWVASFGKETCEVSVLHGPMVETSDDWLVEAVWAGEFSEGNFDQTDLVFGTGIRVRGDKVIFVSSGSTLDRLAYCSIDGVWFVSNSLPAMLAVCGRRLSVEHNYAMGLKTIVKGLSDYTRNHPLDTGEFQLAYFNNLVFDGTDVVEQAKPDVYPGCESYSQYLAYLHSTARALGSNANSDSRVHPIGQLSGISSGYDSIAVTIIAREAGCDQTVTIKQSTSLWRGSDSGEVYADHLQMACRSIDRTASSYPNEESIWAVVGRPGVMNWTLMNYTEPLCLFFNGCQGDKVWERSGTDSSDPFKRASVADLGIGEFRLIQGVFQCPVPYWGIRHFAEIKQLSFHEEMAPWTLHGSYDRPIPRRMIEDAGIRRGSFAKRKKNTSTESKFLWPYSKEAQQSFEKFLTRLGMDALPGWKATVIRRLATIDKIFQKNVTTRLGMAKRERFWDRMAGTGLLFQWANEELTKRYADGLNASRILEPESASVSQ
jgi:hypothetical protein